MKLTQVLLLLSVAAVANCDVGCRSDADCGQGQCCAYVVGKYGSTTCLSQGRPQDSCRPDAGPAAFTVSAPGSAATSVSAHYMLCPCARGLSCQRGVCAQGLPQGSESHPAQIPRPY